MNLKEILKINFPIISESQYRVIRTSVKEWLNQERCYPEPQSIMWQSGHDQAYRELLKELETVEGEQ